MYLKELTQINGISGSEEQVAGYILAKCRPLLGVEDTMTVDRMGSIIFFKKGSQKDNHRIGRNFKVMLCAHTDEVGLMVSGYNDKGCLTVFNMNSGDPQMLQAKRVTVGVRNLSGVIGFVPVHSRHMNKDDKKPDFSDLYIDIGAKTREEAESLVKKGEYAYFIGEYAEYGSNCIKSKAIDDRTGCSIIMEILNERFAFDFYACFSVQEEIGMRGAKVLAAEINPDISIVVEAGAGANDLPGIKSTEYYVQLGEGMTTTLEDSTAIHDRGLVEFIIETARKNRLKIQCKQTTTSVNDTAAIRPSGTGIRTAYVSVPGRYIHTMATMIDRRDYYTCRDILIKALHGMGVDRCKALYEITGGVQDD